MLCKLYNVHFCKSVLGSSSTRRLTELRPSQSADPSPPEHLWEIFHRCIRQNSSPPPTSEHYLRAERISFGRTVFVPLIKFVTMCFSISFGDMWCTNVVLKHGPLHLSPICICTGFHWVLILTQRFRECFLSPASQWIEKCSHGFSKLSFRGFVVMSIKPLCGKVPE